MQKAYELARAYSITGENWNQKHTKISIKMPKNCVKRLQLAKKRPFASLYQMNSQCHLAFGTWLKILKVMGGRK